VILAADIDHGEGGATSSALDSVWLHGFTQTARSWGPLLDAPPLRRTSGRRLRLDLPGHGSSALASGDLWSVGRDVVDTATAHGIQTAVLVGYSLGGRTALHAVLEQPEMWRGVVLIGASPGIADMAARRTRRADDDRLADHLLDIGVAAFVDEWLAQPLFARLRPTDDDIAARLRNTAEGLASSLRHCGTGTQDDLRWRLGELTMPALILAGEHDTKFVAAGRDLADNWGGEAEFVAIEHAGHAAHLERPAQTAAIIGSWWARLR